MLIHLGFRFLRLTICVTRPKRNALLVGDAHMPSVQRGWHPGPEVAQRGHRIVAPVRTGTAFAFEIHGASNELHGRGVSGASYAADRLTIVIWNEKLVSSHQER